MAATLLGAAEIVARSVLGLGTPPLYQADPSIEYVLQPSQNIMRFGNRYAVNQYSMRSRSFPTGLAPREQRILVFGDSVVNGGAQVDQEELATERLQNALQADADYPITVGNISAFSWGPGNWLAYAKRYGLFGASKVVLVVNSDDYADVPTFAPLDPETHPTVKPLLATWEGITRYGPRYLKFPVTRASRSPKIPPAEQIQSALSDLREFLIVVREAGATVVVVQHYQKSELSLTAPPIGLQRIAELCSDLNVPLISLKDDESMHPESTYLDNIHLTPTGQEVLLRGILRAIAVSAA
ncbi:hypothetical protein [Cupriavidus basilensis]|uniref:hypothetical protein n=1 Tax=Cupriavidus basilensis TaxID=68895 RepID=UPI000AF0889B|nr:hypothetical protein [Cupriavidus basilensis]